MRNNKKKGFTLVELLVVIAILAILATVSVVGYTSFIESATVSNDENIAAQLNQFLVAMKADHTGKYYGEKIDENNVREVTDYILKDGGLDELVAQSAKYGYGFYYDLEEGKYVVMHDNDVNVSAMNVIINAFADEGSKYEVKLENSFTKGNRYFYVGTSSETSPLSLIVDAFYNFDSTKYTDLDKMVADLANVGLSNYVKNLVVVTNECNYRLGNDPKYVLFVDGVNQIGTKTATWEDGDWGDPTTSDALATVTGKLTIPASVKYFAVNSLNCSENAELYINQTAEQVSKMASDLFTNSKLILKDGTFYADVLTTGEKGVTNKSAESLVEYPFHYENNLASFGAMLSGTDKKYQNVSLSEGYIAWQDGITVKIDATKFVGEDPNIPATGTEGIVWTSNTTGVTVDANNVIKVDFATANKTTEVELVGTATNGKTHTYKLNFVYPQSFDYTIDGDSVTDNKDTGISLLYSATASTGGKTFFPIAVVLGDYNVTGTGIEVELAYSFAATNFKQNGAAVEVVNADFSGEETITIKTTGYEDKAINLKLFNADSLVFSTNNENINFVADGNAITLGALFNKNDGKTIPNGAQVWIVSDLGDTPFDFNDSEVFATPVNLDSDNWEDTEIQFTDGQNDFTDNNQSDFSVVIVADGYRISTDHKISVVTGVNVDSFADLNGSKNNVLISNISDLPANYAGFTLSQNYTLYGNGFVIDFTGFDDDGVGTGEMVETEVKTVEKVTGMLEGLITLNGSTLNNVKVVGNAYPSSGFNYQNHLDYAYGSSLVLATDGSKIVNAYLANTRSPLRTKNSVTVEDTVLFGGIYANVDVNADQNNKKVTFKGNVVTINQIIEGETDNSLGVGIVVDLFAHKNTTLDFSGCTTFKQYNYVHESAKSLLPVVSWVMNLGDKMGNQGINVFLRDEFNKVFTTAKYEPWVYVQEDGEYFNSGVMFINGFTYTAKGDGLGAFVAAAVKVALEGIFSSSKGDGTKIVDTPDGYVREFTTVERKATVAGCTLEIKEYVYLYSTQYATTPFDNEVPTEYLPSTVLGK